MTEIDDQLFDDAEHEAAPPMMRDGRLYSPVLVVGEPIASVREFEAQFGGPYPVARVVFCTEAEDGSGEELGGQWPGGQDEIVCVGSARNGDENPASTAC